MYSMFQVVHLARCRQVFIAWYYGLKIYNKSLNPSDSKHFLKPTFIWLVTAVFVDTGSHTIVIWPQIYPVKALWWLVCNGRT